MLKNSEMFQKQSEMFQIQRLIVQHGGVDVNGDQVARLRKIEDVGV